MSQPADQKDQNTSDQSTPPLPGVEKEPAPTITIVVAEPPGGQTAEPAPTPNTSPQSAPTSPKETKTKSKSGSASASPRPRKARPKTTIVSTIHDTVPLDLLGSGKTNDGTWVFRVN
jgi:hypothetical protein